MRHDLRLDLERRDVDAAPADHVLLAVEEVEAPLLVLHHLVAGVEPAVAPSVRRRLGHVLVAGVDHPRQAVPCDQLAGRADRDGHVVLVDQPQLVVHGIRGLSAVAGLDVLRVDSGRDRHRHLGHAEGRVDVDAEPLRELLVVRERPHVDGLQRVVAVARRRRLVGQERHHAVDGDRNRRVEPPDVVPERARAEPLVQRHRAAGEQHRVRDPGARRVEHRQRVEVAVLLRDVREDEAAGVVPECGVRGSHAFGRARRARGVDQAQVVPRLGRPGHRRALLAGTAEDLVERNRAPGQLHVRLPAHRENQLEVRQVAADEALEELVVRDEHLGLGEVERVLEVRALRRERQRRIRRADRVRPEPAAEDVWPRRHPDGDVVAGIDADLLQRVAGPPCLAHRVGVRPLLLLEEQERLVGRRLGSEHEQVRDDALLARRERELAGQGLGSRHY